MWLFCLSQDSKWMHDCHTRTFEQSLWNYQTLISHYRAWKSLCHHAWTAMSKCCVSVYLQGGWTGKKVQHESVAKRTKGYLWAKILQEWCTMLQALLCWSIVGYSEGQEKPYKSNVATLPLSLLQALLTSCQSESKLYSEYLVISPADKASVMCWGFCNDLSYSLSRNP